jgi:hypothetical protein
MPPTRLSDIDVEHLAAKIVRDAVATVTRLFPALAPLLRIEVRGPFHDLPEGVEEETGLLRSHVFGTQLGLLARDLLLFAKDGVGSPEEAVEQLINLNELLGRAEPSVLGCDGDVEDALYVIARAVLARVTIARGDRVPLSFLAALGSVPLAIFRELVEAGEIVGTADHVHVSEARRWLATRGVSV